MLDKQLLKDIGFRKGTGWDHEVWVYDGMFWLHYGEYDHDKYLSLPTALDGVSLSRKEFFAKFLEAVKDEARESTWLTEDW